MTAFHAFLTPERRSAVAYHTIYGVLFLMQLGASIFPEPRPSNLLQGFITHLLGDVKRWSDHLKDLIERPSEDPTSLVAFLTGAPAPKVSWLVSSLCPTDRG